MEESDEMNLDIYVSNPVLNKESIGSYTSYTLRGKKVPEPLSRRYKDFDAFRKQLVDRWPGVYIPNIPHKQVVGAKDKEVVDMRIEQINRFLDKLSKIEYLFKSDETQIFLQNVQDVAKSFAAMGAQNYEDLLKKYSGTFIDYDDNFDIEQGKVDQEKFLIFLKESYPRIRAFRELIRSSKENYKFTQESNTLFLNMLSLYEKDTLVEFTQNEDNLLFFNMKNVELNQNINDVKDNLINPYDKLFDSITEDMLDTEAMIEAFDTLQGLNNQLEKINRNLNATIAQLAEVGGGKTNLKSILSFKSKEKETQSLTELQNKLDKDKANLEQIIKIAIFNMEEQMNTFKKKRLDMYYDELTKLEEDQNLNNNTTNKLWDSVMNDQNIQNINQS